MLFFSENSDTLFWNKLNPESNYLKINIKFSLKSKIHFEIFPRNDFKFPLKKRHTTFLQPLQRLGVKFDMRKI